MQSEKTIDVNELIRNQQTRIKNLLDEVGRLKSENQSYTDCQNVLKEYKHLLYLERMRSYSTKSKWPILDLMLTLLFTGAVVTIALKMTCII